jgi:hypothetical protein
MRRCWYYWNCCFYFELHLAKTVLIQDHEMMGVIQHHEIVGVSLDESCFETLDAKRILILVLILFLISVA